MKSLIFFSILAVTGLGIVVLHLPGIAISDPTTPPTETVLSNLNTIVGILVGCLTLISIISGFVLNYVIGAKIDAKLALPNKRISRIERRMVEIASASGVDLSTFAFKDGD